MLEKRKRCSLSGDDGLDEKYVKRENCINLRMQKGQKHFFRESRERGPFICFIMDNENKSTFAGDSYIN